MKPHTTSKKELDDLRAVVDRDLEDADIEELSEDRRFATAYNAALQAATIVLYCAGYRTSGVGHHQTTFEAVDLAIGSPATAYANFFEACRRKRNRVDYDMSGIATRTEVEQIIKETKAFLGLAEGWVAAQHPNFAKT